MSTIIIITPPPKTNSTTSNVMTMKVITADGSNQSVVDALRLAADHVEGLES